MDAKKIGKFISVNRKNTDCYKKNLQKTEYNG